MALTPKLTSPGVLKRLLDDHHIRLSKRYGQNFLCDENTVARIVAAATPAEGVLEIGPGVGTLTVALAAGVERVVAVEIDGRLIPLLESHLSDFDNVSLIHADVLHVSWETLAKRLGTPFDVVGNLPYQITSPLLDKLVQARDWIGQGVLMVQRELADKLLAPVGGGKGSALGVFLQAFAEVERLFHVSKGVFFPRPQVDSTVLRLRFFRERQFQADETTFFSVVRAAFNLRRKTLRQALHQSPFLRLPADQAGQVLAHARIDPARRGETLTLEEFDRIALQLQGSSDS